MMAVKRLNLFQFAIIKFKVNDILNDESNFTKTFLWVSNNWV